MWEFTHYKTAFYLSVFILFIGIDVQAREHAVHIRGSTTLMPIAQKVAETYMAEHEGTKIVISGGGTAHGYKAVMDGTADIAMASSLIPDDIKNQCQLKGIELRHTLLGYATILAVVNPSNNVMNLSLTQLKDIFTGRIKNWKKVGGIDAPITIYVGPPTGGITDTWKSLILGVDDTYTPAGIVLNNSERLQKITTETNAITFLTLDKSNYEKLKVLKINNVSPDKFTVGNGSYTLRAPLLLITTAHPTAEVLDFIRYFSAPEQANNVGEMVRVVADEKDDHHE